MIEGCIYLDNNATTACDPQVVRAMLPWFTERFGNPASITHPYGWQAEDAVEEARGRVARLVGARPHEIVFTSGATESNAIALASARLHEGAHVVVSCIEHKSVLGVAEQLEAEGHAVTRLPVDSTGRVDPGAVARALRPNTAWVSVMHANHEIGTLNPIAEIGAICRERGVLLHTDATQSLGKVPIDVGALGVDAMSISGHKLHGPKGVGALFVRTGVRLAPLFRGGGQQGGLRSGTIPVPLVVGLGEACELAAATMEPEGRRIAALRDRLFARLGQALPGIRLNGHPTARLPGNLNVALVTVDAESVLEEVREVLAISTGSACVSARLEPSYVLTSLGLPPAVAQSSLRFGIGRFNTRDEIDRAADLVARAVRARGRGRPLPARTTLTPHLEREA